MQISQENNFKYDAYFQWIVTYQCNFSCIYCSRGKIDKKGWKANNKINIKKLMNTLDKTGKIYKISFTGGEPFLVENLIETLRIIKESLSIFFSNLSTNKISEFVDEI